MKDCFLLCVLLLEKVCLYKANNDNFVRRRSSVGLQRRVSDHKVADSMLALGINDNYPTKHFVQCGRLAQVSVSQRHTPEKNEMKLIKSKRTCY